MGHGKEFDSDIKEPLVRGDFYWPAMPEGNHHDLFSEPTPSAEYLEDWLIRTCEIIDEYKPKIVYFDWWIQHSAFKPYIKKLAAITITEHMSGEQKLSLIISTMLFSSALPYRTLNEASFANVQPYYWQTDTAIALNSWCYTENNDFRNPVDLVCDLVDIVSKNGNLLLNVGPKSDGTISEEDTAVLKGIGSWLKINGEAIYGTTYWKIFWRRANRR